MQRLLLIRHAMPEIDPAVPAARWRLSPDGRAAARRLAAAVPPSARFVASTERKAAETLEEIAAGAPVAREAGFAEVRRPDAWSGEDDYRAAVRAYLNGERHAGWERHDDVVERFDAAIGGHGAYAGTLVVGTHGIALTLWLASRHRLDPVAFWSGLRMPDLISPEWPLGSVTR